MCLYYISVACDLLQITIGLCFFIRMYQRKQFNVSRILISKRRIGILKKLPKQGKDSESL